MLQQEKPEDFVIATGRMESVRKFVELSAKSLGWVDNYGTSIIWEGKGLNEVGKRADTNEIVIKVDSRYFRPTEVMELKGDASRAKEKLGWEPKISLDQLVEEMIEFDLKKAELEKITRGKSSNF